MSQMLILNKNGHDTITFTTADPTTVEKARVEFSALQEQGYSALARYPGDEGMIAMPEFNPEAEEIICFGRIVGG